MAANDERLGHATLDLATRAAKGRKIERLLALSDSHGRRLLEVGTGAGGIAHYFATAASPPFDVHAVDVEDQRQVREGFQFSLVDSTALPFANESFDVVVSNHVIEHVGDQDAQRHHLTEIARVLRPGGRVYLAVPNRWMVVEPHYRLAFLSWLPRSWRTPYLKISGRGIRYDCEPLRRIEVEELVASAGFTATNVAVRAIRQMVLLEPQASFFLRVISRFPDGMLRLFERVIPTHIYILERAT